MKIQVEGIGFPNKGAELMLYAVAQQFQAHYGHEVDVCCYPRQGYRSSYRLLGYQNISQLGHFTVKGFELDKLINLLPYKLLDTFGITKTRDVDIVIDASGLRYTDKWGANIARKVAKRYKAYRAQGKKIIMLPQAFGPFENKEVAEAVSEIVGVAEICYAREEVSAEHLRSIVDAPSKVEVAPDFTNLISGYKNSPIAEKYTGYVVVIPNGRMFDKTSAAVSAIYYEYLCNFVNNCKNRGEKVLILNHEGEPDHELCLKLAKDCSVTDVFSTWDPILIKTIIGKGKYVMSSRFHGCVSALSQGVPVIATSWNHKYEMLLTEYGLSKNVESLQTAKVDESMIYRCEDDTVVANIQRVALEMKDRSKAMWQQVFSEL
ncbi:MAG: polysaccharide pyruvyl transferase family protein [Patiriisocius sp.]|uniref:polysaccharide pyruvyl transferase family protein n=1 Tax=Patiriisocius sp. TaxID=2822396 RepID=UPI003EF8019E